MPQYDIDELNKLSDQEVFQLVAEELETMNITANVLPQYQVPMNVRPKKDEDGFSISPSGTPQNLQAVQKALWAAFQASPLIYSSAIDYIGRLTGQGFEISSIYPKADRALHRILTDPRNDFYTNLQFYVAREFCLGELFLTLTPHDDGFCEIDYIDPSSIAGGDDGTGIFTPPGKPFFPILYKVGEEYIPSINIAYYPDLTRHYPDTIPTDKIKENVYMVQWLTGLGTLRNAGRLASVARWVAHHENLKLWELDHKRAAASYLWVISCQDAQSWRLWLALSDEDKKKTGLLQKKKPGSTIMLPPGFKMSAETLKLPTLSGEDRDILNLISAGLNTSEQALTGNYSGSTYGGIKMSGGPQSDRTADAITRLDRFLKYNLLRGILFFASKNTPFPNTYKHPRPQRIDKNGKVIIKNMPLELWETVEISYPVSAQNDLEGLTRALMGVKHSDLSTSLGIPRKKIAERLGFGAYHQCRLETAVEDMLYPKLSPYGDQEAKTQQNEPAPGFSPDKKPDVSE